MEKYINDAINSVLSQTYKDIELIIVNDGSTDSSEEIILSRKQEIKSVLSDFKYLKQENAGVSATCQIGFKKVTGEYLALLDGDDCLLPTSIEKQKDFLEKNQDYAAVRTNGYYTYLENDGEKRYLIEDNSQTNEETTVWEDILLGKKHAFAGGYMVRVCVLDEVYPNREIYLSRYGQNLQFLLAPSYHRKVGFIDEPLMKYNIRKSSMTHKTEKDQEKRENELTEGFKDIRKHIVNYFFYEEEKEEYLKKIEILYTRMHLRIANKYKDKILANEKYKKLEVLTGNHISKSDKRLLYSTKYPIYQKLYSFIYRIRRKIKRDI